MGMMKYHAAFHAHGGNTSGRRRNRRFALGHARRSAGRSIRVSLSPGRSTIGRRARRSAVSAYESGATTSLHIGAGVVPVDTTLFLPFPRASTIYFGHYAAARSRIGANVTASMPLHFSRLPRAPITRAYYATGDIARALALR